MSWLRGVYCRRPVACSPSATLQKELMEDNGPRPLGVLGDGDEIGAVLCLGGQRGPDCIGDTASTALIFS